MCGTGDGEALQAVSVPIERRRVGDGGARLLATLHCNQS